MNDRDGVLVYRIDGITLGSSEIVFSPSGITIGSSGGWNPFLDARDHKIFGKGVDYAGDITINSNDVPKE